MKYRWIFRRHQDYVICKFALEGGGDANTRNGDGTGSCGLLTVFSASAPCTINPRSGQFMRCDGAICISLSVEWLLLGTCRVKDNERRKYERKEEGGRVDGGRLSKQQD